jgi:hypothetical protein
MRILFTMAYPGYLRYFDATIRALAERGHDVELYFDRPQKQEEGLAATAAMPPNVHVRGDLPDREPQGRVDVRQLRRVTNFVRYLDPRFANAHYLRDRRAAKLPPQWQQLARRRTLPGPVARPLLRLMIWIECAVPPSAELERFVEEVGADVVVAASLVAGSSRETDLVQSANARGVPTAAAIASWDHLTTKGMLRVPTRRVLVWNETQRREAIELHRVPGDCVVVTGAQPFDRWFERRPELEPEAFRERVGLPPDRPFLLFAGSTAGISRPDAEHQFVRRWIEALRASEDESAREASVLVRPHPYNSDSWRGVTLDEYERVSVWPRHGANPVDEADRSDYFHSLLYAGAVVGINTSAMIEAAIVGTPVLTVTSPDFTLTQEGTLHFHYLLPENGGFLRVARSLDEHVGQLASVLGAPERTRDELESFVRRFIRPHGLDRPATPFVVEAIESLPSAAPVRQQGALSRRGSRVALRLWTRWNRRAAQRPVAAPRSVGSDT